EADEHGLDRRRTVVLGRELGRVVALERELAAMVLLGAEAEEPRHRALAVRAAHPLVRGAPRELGGFRRGAQQLAGAEQERDVHAVVDGRSGVAHVLNLRIGSRTPPHRRSADSKSLQYRSAFDSYRRIRDLAGLVYIRSMRLLVIGGTS